MTQQDEGEGMRMTWLPIESAPKDGTQVLTWNGIWLDLSYWSRPDRLNRPAWLGAHDGGTNHIDQPTHWMPLPEPPTEDDLP